MKQLGFGNVRRRFDEHPYEFFRGFFRSDCANAFVELLEVIGSRLIVLV